MPDSPSAWLRSLAAEATRMPDPHKDPEEQWIARGRAINQARKLAPDLAVLCADAIDALERIAAFENANREKGKCAAIARDALARFAALQPDNTEEER